MGKTKTQHPERYTDPELREQIKDDITESSKGGPPGKWGMRKAQLTASEYEKHGGEYNGDKKDRGDDAKNLSNSETNANATSADSRSNKKKSSAGSSTSTRRSSRKTTKSSSKDDDKEDDEQEEDDEDDSSKKSSSQNGSKKRKSTGGKSGGGKKKRAPQSKQAYDSKEEIVEQDERYQETGDVEDNRCQPGYEPVPGKEPFSRGSCKAIK